MATKQVVIFYLECLSSTATVDMIDKTLIAFISCVVMRSLYLL